MSALLDQDWCISRVIKLESNLVRDSLLSFFIFYRVILMRILTCTSLHADALFQGLYEIWKKGIWASVWCWERSFCVWNEVYLSTATTALPTAAAQGTQDIPKHSHFDKYWVASRILSLWGFWSALTRSVFVNHSPRKCNYHIERDQLCSLQKEHSSVRNMVWQ